MVSLLSFDDDKHWSLLLPRVYSNMFSTLLNWIHISKFTVKCSQMIVYLRCCGLLLASELSIPKKSCQAALEWRIVMLKCLGVALGCVRW